MNRQQWLEWRLDGLGSSDAAVIMGVSPWKSLSDLWIEKKHRIIWGKKNASMQYGHDNEEQCRQKFEETMDVSVFPRNLEHEEFNWLRASYDGIDVDEKIAVEIKNPNAEDHKDARSGNVPIKYYPQCQHLIKVRELKNIFYLSHFRGDYAIVDVKRDERYLKEYFQKADDFWKSVFMGDPPSKKDEDFVFRADPEWQDRAERSKILLARMKKDKEEIDLIKRDLVSIGNGFNSIGSGICLQKSTCEGRLDMASLKKDYPDIDFDSYRKSSYDRWNLKALGEED